MFSKTRKNSTHLRFPEEAIDARSHSLVLLLSSFGRILMYESYLFREVDFMPSVLLWLQEQRKRTLRIIETVRGRGR